MPFSLSLLGIARVDLSVSREKMIHSQLPWIVGSFLWTQSDYPSNTGVEEGSNQSVSHTAASSPEVRESLINSSLVAS